MDNFYEAMRLAAKINAQLAPLINTQKNLVNISKSFANISSIALKAQSLNEYYFKNMRNYQNLLNSIPKYNNFAVNNNLINIKNNLDFIMSNDMLNVPIPKTDKLISSIKDASNYIQDNSDIDTSEIDSLISNNSTSLTDETKIYDTSATPINNQNWYSITMLILTALSVILPLLSYVKPINQPIDNNISTPIINPKPELGSTILIALEQIELTLNCIENSNSDT